MCFVCALSSHISHTPPHPLLGQDHQVDDNVVDHDDDDDEHDNRHNHHQIANLR